MQIDRIHYSSDTGRQPHHHSTFTSPCLTTPRHHWTRIFWYPLSSTPVDININILPCLGDGLARASYHQHTTAWPRVMLVI